MNFFRSEEHAGIASIRLRRRAGASSAWTTWSPSSAPSRASTCSTPTISRPGIPAAPPSAAPSSSAPARRCHSGWGRQAPREPHLSSLRGPRASGPWSRLCSEQPPLGISVRVCNASGAVRREIADCREAQHMKSKFGCALLTGVFLSLSLAAALVMAADHRDAPTIDDYSAIDINDVFMSRDPADCAPGPGSNLVVAISTQAVADPLFGSSYHFQENALYQLNFTTRADAKPTAHRFRVWPVQQRPGLPGAAACLPGL